MTAIRKYLGKLLAQGQSSYKPPALDKKGNERLCRMFEGPLRVDPVKTV
jgi:hypothetical protein